MVAAMASHPRRLALEHGRLRPPTVPPAAPSLTIERGLLGRRNRVPHGRSRRQGARIHPTPTAGKPSEWLLLQLGNVYAAA